MKKTTINGTVCCGVGDAAKYIGTNAKGIRKLIDAGEIEIYSNGRLNSTRIYLSVESLVNVKYRKAAR
jgi:hypothetical protein